MYHLVSFADSRVRRSLERLSAQAKSITIFETIRIFDEHLLPSPFRERFKEKLITGSRGYGYWSWKPEVILETLGKMKKGDCLLYVDAGCHLNPQGKTRLIEYFEILMQEEKGIVAFQANPPDARNSALKHDGRKLFDQPNYRWIKGDLLDYFGVRQNSAVVEAQAIGAGIILVKKCEGAIEIIKEWRKIIWDRFDLLDDTPSVSPNLPGFIEHRHDQAIWTLLCLKHKIKTLSAYEYWYPQKHKLIPDWGALQEFPVHARQDKDLGVWRNLLSRVARHINRLRNLFARVKSLNLLGRLR